MINTTLKSTYQSPIHAECTVCKMIMGRLGIDNTRDSRHPQSCCKKNDRAQYNPERIID